MAKSCSRYFKYEEQSMSEGDLCMPTKIWIYFTYFRHLTGAFKLVMQLPFGRRIKSQVARAVPTVRQSHPDKWWWSKDLWVLLQLSHFWSLLPRLSTIYLLLSPQKRWLCGGDRWLCEFVLTGIHFDYGVTTKMAITLLVIAGSCDWKAVNQTDRK